MLWRVLRAPGRADGGHERGIRVPAVDQRSACAARSERRAQRKIIVPISRLAGDAARREARQKGASAGARRRAAGCAHRRGPPAGW